MSPSAVFKLYDSSDLLEFNIQQHLDSKFLLNGMYTNVELSQQWYSNSRLDVLTRIDSKTYQSQFDNWVFENTITGISGYNTKSVSGVYIDSSFEQRGSGTYVPHIDYSNGRVIFENNVPSGAVVSADFTYKLVNVTFPDSEKAKIIFSNFKYGQDAESINLPSGNSSQLPIVAINLTNRDSDPWQLGGGQLVTQDVSFHIVANDRRTVNKIVDLLTIESYKNTIKGVDFNSAPTQFDFYGDKAATYQDYVDLQNNSSLSWYKLYVSSAKIMESVSEYYGVYTARVDWDLEFYAP